jgi:hypothetical protein
VWLRVVGAPGFVFGCLRRAAAAFMTVVHAPVVRRIPLKLPISWACKLAYVVYMALFMCLGLKWQVFAYSAWIINDQVRACR